MEDAFLASGDNFRNQCSLTRFTDMRKSGKKMNPNNRETIFLVRCDKTTEILEMKQT